MKFSKYFFAILLFYSYAAADQRSFVWTYEYLVIEPGEAEIEQYTTINVSDLSNFKGNTLSELNLEAEIGMNEHYDFAIYQNFKQESNGNLVYSGFKLRTRYKIGQKGDLFIDPLIYLEYIGVPDFQNHKIEAKLILAKDISNFTIAVNPYFEYEINEVENEFLLKYAVGIKYQITKILSFGIESKGDKNAKYIGPTIAHGSKKYWSALGLLYGIGKITEGKPEFQMRLIIGLFL